ncbi:TctA family transporter [Xaviernesmea oryzae]|uniref:TctA family transporter n=1 Tax=Xaviernesmea oryzae TaxID=464029 RepID=A0A1X7FQB0_9HYPH|nr:tripartite tricarboxylate transporter permease [Xaviernesmea oryzae]SMF56656.1 TctA family transporter [Xaviernesmea oryzae]
MDFLNNIVLGLDTAFSATNLLYCFAGVFLGTAIGVLPGLGPVPTIAMLLPITYTLDPVTAIIMLAGIYYGSQYGGSTTAILVNLPGESSSVVTCLDGHEMAKRGRAGVALAIAALGSFFAGTVATLVIAGFAPSLANFALEFGAPDYFSLVVLGLVSAVILAHGSILKAFASMLLGIILGLIGTDSISGASRYTFGVVELFDGIEFVAVAMGFFAFSEIIRNLSSPASRDIVATKIINVWPNLSDFRKSWKPVLRGTALGSLLGVLPGGGATLSSWTSYALEKRLSSHPEEFGKGAIEGVAGPEAANNAGAQTSFIPMLTLGIPSNGVMAMMVGAMMIHSIVPGPSIIEKEPALFWGLIVSMWIGNLMLIVLNMPLIGLWVKLLKVPYDIMFPFIVVVCCVGIYSIKGGVFDIYMAAIFGVFGFLFSKLECEPAPLLLGFILGPMMEENFRRALLISRGEFSIFVTSPVSCVLLLLAVTLLMVVVAPSIRRRRKEAFAEES